MPSSTNAYKRIIVHVPMKVKHHHHTHTVVKHVHHEVPMHYDHQDVHVIHENHGEEYESDYHYPPGRTLDSILGGISYGVSDRDRAGDYENFERILKKRKIKKLFSNMAIGWKGRSDFDKIASEYLASIVRRPHPEPDDDYNDRFIPYDDNEQEKK